ncbi:hypothetical protein M9Y10_043327 [Tritrichomonas musculus]|uniref:HNH nuclease domain-containing protein n=1 Tax=Tritrichomonas musculus TaxID=1915356 RepID=A0ABR2JZR2_9EUKA
MSYVELVDHSDYEILNEYPFTIRRKDNQYEPSETYNKDGYKIVTLNGKSYLKHRLIAEQFISNDDPEHKTQVDHINHDRTDYHLSNLRWVTPKQNNMNKISYNGVECEYVDDLPIDVVPIILYNGFEFDGYFIDQDGNVWFDNGEQFRKLHVGKKNTVCIRDIYHKRHDFGIRGLRREFI